MSTLPDFSVYGAVTERRLPRLQTLTAKAMLQNWTTIPHVTHHDDADVTELDARRKAWSLAHPESRLSLLPLIMTAAASVLREYPKFNASLDAERGTLVEKQYIHLGIAVDTPGGLLVPVIRDCNARTALDIAEELRSVSQKAREKGLSYAEMSGSSFSISSIGAAGGTGFTPIINAPDVAILGVAATAIRPVWSGTSFEPRLILPLSLSYDHRVINGVEAARFLRSLANKLADHDIDWDVAPSPRPAP